MFKNALNATYLEAPVERGVSRENTVIRAAQATEETTPGAGFPDGGKQLATMKPVPSAHFQTFPDKAKQLAKRIKL
jgi:hypothetical protein